MSRRKTAKPNPEVLVEPQVEVEVPHTRRSGPPAKRKRRGDCAYSPATVEKIFESLTTTGSMVKAAQAAGVSISGIYFKRSHDPQFEELCEQAKEIYVTRLEEEIDRRAYEGFERGIWHNGKKVGTEKQYSDLLAMFRLKKLDPSYRDKQDTNIKVGVGISITGE